jgi:diaminopimelate decarboxylase
MNTRKTLKINGNGLLEIGGVTATDLAKCFGTPLYVLDEAYIRAVCRAFASRGVRRKQCLLRVKGTFVYGNV